MYILASDFNAKDDKYIFKAKNSCGVYLSFFFLNFFDDLFIGNLQNSRLKPGFRYIIFICICVGVGRGY